VWVECRSCRCCCHMCTLCVFVSVLAALKSEDQMPHATAATWRQSIPCCVHACCVPPDPSMLLALVCLLLFPGPCCCCRGQAYVAAFLSKSSKGSAEESADKDKGADKEKGVDSSSEQQAGSAADSLYEVGTFAQVHTMMSGDTPDSAQLLLLGHRRLKRESIVSRHHS